MNNPPASSSTKSAPATPGSSNQQGKTQVFILTPDILKKLGIASKLPNLTTKSVENNPISKPTAQIKKDNSTLVNVKNKLSSVLNKKIDDSTEIKTVRETKKADNNEATKKQNEEDSVKSKLLSMLTSKLEKEKVKSASSSTETKNDKQTKKFENQIKPKKGITSNLKDIKVIQDSHIETKTLETDLKIKVVNKNDITAELELEINTKHDPVNKLNESIKNKLSETTDFESLKQTSLLKNMLSKENKNKCLKTNNENNSSNITNSNIAESHKKIGKTTHIQQEKIASNITKTKHEEVSELKHSETSTPRGKKRKVTEDILIEDLELISPVRKSGRKRKLSTLHSDYVTELKLHDGSTKKLSNKDWTCTEMKQNMRDIDELKLINKTEKLVGIHETPIDVDITNITSENDNAKDKDSKSKNTEENKKLLVYQRPNNECNKSETILKNILLKPIKKQNSDKSKEYSQLTHNDTPEENTSKEMEKDKFHKTSAENETAQQDFPETSKSTQQEINLPETIVTDSPVNNGKIIINKNKSNSNETSKNDTKVNKEADTNIKESGKKQIIILENIVVKSISKDICTRSTENTQKSSPETLPIKNITCTLEAAKSKEILIKNTIINEADSSTDLNLKETKSENIKARFSTDVGRSSENKTPTILLSDTEHNRNLNELIVDTSLTIPKENISLDFSDTKINKNIDESDQEICKLDESTKDKMETSNDAHEDTRNYTEKISPETIILVRKRRSRPGKDNSEMNKPINKLSSGNSSEPEASKSAAVTMETKITEQIDEINAKLEKLPDVETPPVISNVRKRGRPPKQKKIQEPENTQILKTVDLPTITEENKIDESEKHISEITPHTTITSVRKRGRPPKVNRNLQQSVNFYESKAFDPVGRGRKRNKEGGSRKVTCAICKEVMQSSFWNTHTLTHNFLCWQVGDPPMDLNDRKFVEYVLFKSIKSNKKFKTFACPNCGDKKKSVLGFLAHLDVCQLSDEERLALMVPCAICKKKVMPQSVKYHMKAHEDHPLYVIKAGDQSIEDIDLSRTKRKAAAKAENLIQEVSNQESIPTDTKKEVGKRLYKKAKDPGSVFITYGVMKKLESAFNKGQNKCKYKHCNFKANTFIEMREHLNACPTLNEDDYICRYCFIVKNDEKVIIEHIKANHFSTPRDYQSYGSGSESEEDVTTHSGDELNRNHKAKKLSKPSTQYIKPTFRIGFLSRERRIIRDPVCTYLPALKWTSEFCLEHYSEKLFENIKCLSSKWSSIPLNEQDQYIPRLKKSMSVKSCTIVKVIPNLQKDEHEWKEYDLYESNLNDDTVTVFCGGPIWALAWAPTPQNKICDQYLAVSLQKDFETTYKLSEAVSDTELIQFWNFGPLESRKPIENTPILEFNMAHNHGMVWCMEWCPSGFYDTEDPSDSDEFKKLGLLALACSDGNIPIYAIGIPHLDDNNENNIFEIKPAFKLILQEPTEHLLGRWEYQATKLSWSRSSGHNNIAGGYSNGMVCLWDLQNSSPLLRTETEDLTILKPYHSFQAHTSAISALILYPLIDDGKRWLLTGSWDRTFKYWDVNNTSAPFVSFGKRGIITDGVWISHWLCSFVSFDDVFSLGHTVTTVQNPRDFGFKQCSALASNSVVMGLSANDWASAVAQGTLAGELTTTFPRTILISYDVDKNLKCKRILLSYNELIDKTKDVSERKDIMKSEKKSSKAENEKDDKLFSKYFINNKNKPYVEQPNMYEKAREKYGMLFCDFKLNHFSSVPPESFEVVKQSSKLREVPTELYPFTSLNRVAWNPNKQAYLYIVSGYQNGFMRLRCIRFMNTNQPNMLYNNN